MEWEQPITIGSTDSAGSVSINLFHNPKQFVPVTWTDSSGPWHGKDEYHMKKKVASSMDQNRLEATRNSLRSALTELGKFIVPTGETFITSNPKFNNTGDLLFELQYRG